VFSLDLAAPVDAPRRAGHELHVVIVALALLDLPDDVLDVSEPIGLGELQLDSFRRLEDHFSQVLVATLDILKLVRGPG